MNISEKSPLPGIARFTAEIMRVPDGELADVRTKLYHSSGDGYYVFRKFVPPDIVQHMRNIWTSVDPVLTHIPFPGNEYVSVGSPDYYARYEDGSTIFYNFMFAEPLDEVTREVGVCVHALRNRLSGRNAFSDLCGPRTAVSYRVTMNKNYENWIAPHRDFLEYEKRWEKGQYDPSRLQATLFLSRKGDDYEGDAFSMERNDGRQVAFGTDVQIEPGDLVVWKYTNLHGVSRITTPPGKIGLLRIIFPVHDLSPARTPILQSARQEVLPVRYLDLLDLVARRGAKGVLRRIRAILGS